MNVNTISSVMAVAATESKNRVVLPDAKPGEVYDIQHPAEGRSTELDALFSRTGSSIRTTRILESVLRVIPWSEKSRRGNR
jgi:hypothetical protein